MIKEVIVENEKQLKYVYDRKDIKNIILSIDSFDKESIKYYATKIREKEKDVYLRLERITRRYVLSYDEYINNENIKGFLVENMDSLGRLLSFDKSKNKTIELDYTMNICNEEAKNAYANIGDFKYTYPIELSAYDMRKIKMDTIIVYSDLPTMVSAICPLDTMKKCDKNNKNMTKTAYLIDRKKKKVHFKSYCNYHYTKIFNPDYYYIYDLLDKDKDIKNLSYKKIRFEFALLDDLDKIGKILDCKINTGENTKENFTRGHIKKSIQ